MSREQGSTFVPFSFESYGGFGPSSQSFVKALTKFARDSQKIDTSQIKSFRDSIIHSVEAAIQFGNWMIVSMGTQQSKSKAAALSRLLAPHSSASSPSLPHHQFMSPPSSNQRPSRIPISRRRSGLREGLFPSPSPPAPPPAPPHPPPPASPQVSFQVNIRR